MLRVNVDVHLLIPGLFMGGGNPGKSWNFVFSFPGFESHVKVSISLKCYVIMELQEIKTVKIICVI